MTCRAPQHKAILETLRLFDRSAPLLDERERGSTAAMTGSADCPCADPNPWGDDVPRVGNL